MGAGPGAAGHAGWAAGHGGAVGALWGGRAQGQCGMRLVGHRRSMTQGLAGYGDREAPGQQDRVWGRQGHGLVEKGPVSELWLGQGLDVAQDVAKVQ